MDSFNSFIVKYTCINRPYIYGLLIIYIYWSYTFKIILPYLLPCYLVVKLLLFSGFNVQWYIIINKYRLVAL